MYCNLYVLSVNAISRIVGEIGRMSSRPCWADLGEHLSAGIFTVYVCLSLDVDHRRSKEKVFPAVSTWVVKLYHLRQTCVTGSHRTAPLVYVVQINVLVLLC